MADSDGRIDLHGSVQVPRAALYGFRDFLTRFLKETITSAEWKEKMRWIDSLLEAETDDD
ncbi:hypothetical protein LCGC14_1350140 [marine sediment metagenome]|uniref:Uncharacterized protein n=1 Tax=marine sediment metagenome TaxID=412755 RepID=A0A0F9KB84_9ZZZZ